MVATDPAVHRDSGRVRPRTDIETFVSAVALLPGQILLSWSMAGGLVAGGFLVAAVTLTGQSSSTAVPHMSSLLFVVGAVVGLAHGGLLGYLCRDPARTRTDLGRTLIHSLVWLPPALLVTWVAALWISLTAPVVLRSTPMPFRIGWIVLAWLFGAVVCAWAAVVGARGVVAALRRWPDIRIAAVAVSVVFAVLVTRFLSAPPEIWFTELRVTTVGAVILAFGASVWIALPVAIAALRLLHRIRRGS